MASNNSVAAASSHGSSLPLPACVLLSSNICVGTCSRWDATTAATETSNKLPVEASLSLAPPPRLSDLTVYCPGADLTVQPTIIFTAKDLILFRVAVCRRYTSMLDNCDYFIYRAGSAADHRRRPSLTLVPRPKPNLFRDGVVGVLSRGGGLYSIAALLATGDDEYELCRFDSEVGSWVTKAVSLEAPRRPFPPDFKTRRGRPHYHETSTTITVGGEAGAMGWVDLWGGILFYDLLRDDDQDTPKLRHLPLPLPSDILEIKDWKGVKLNCPDTRRAVFASIKDDGRACLKLADLQATCERLHYTDVETGWPVFAIDDWTVTVWSMEYGSGSGSCEDWHEDFTVRASDIMISDEVRSQLLKSGLLHRKPSQVEEEAIVEVALQNLVVSEPNVSLNGDEYVVFVVARTKFKQRKAWLLAIDMRNCTLLG